MSFFSEELDRSRIPVAIVSGFLGSGKTTLINAVLKDPRLTKTAVAINEFGEVPVDHHLIDHGEDRTIVMANGCLCCNLAGDMEDAVMRVFSRRESGDIPDFDRLIVEPSGLSDPAPIAHAILRHPMMSRTFSLQSMIVTVDAVLAPTQIKRFPEVVKQIGLADIVIITKSDLVDPSAIANLKKLLTRTNPIAPQIVATAGAIDPAEIFPDRFFDPEAGDQPVADWLSKISNEVHSSAHSHHSYAIQTAHRDMRSVSVISSVPLPWRPLEQWLREIRLDQGERMLRIKGIVDIQGHSSPIVVQAVGHVQSVPVELVKWPSSDRRSRIIFIGDSIDIERISESWLIFCQNHTAAPVRIAK